MSTLFEEPEDDEQDLAFLGVRPAGRTCPECRGSCEDKHGNPCETCFGEGEI